MGRKHLRANAQVSRVHTTRGAQRIVGIECARRLRRDVGVVQLIDRDVGEPGPRHPALRSRGQLEPGGDPGTARGAQRWQVDVVFPLVPTRLFHSPNALRVFNEQPSGAHPVHGRHDIEAADRDLTQQLAEVIDVERTLRTVDGVGGEGPHLGFGMPGVGSKAPLPHR